MTTYPAFRLTLWVKRLLIANVAAFFLQETVFNGRDVAELFGFTPARLLEHLWSPVTYMFVHTGFFQIAFTMLMLFIFGPAVEERLGHARFIRFYVICGLGAVALKLVTAAVLGSPMTTVVGASAAVFGVALAFAWAWPDMPIRIFPVPVPISAPWVVAFLATANMVVLVASRTAPFDPFPHVGGFAAAFFFLRIHFKPEKEPMEAVHRLSAAKVLVPQQRDRVEEAESVEVEATTSVPPGAPTPADRQAEIDRVLDKISRSGIESLTPAERQFLEDASEGLGES